MTRAQKAQLKSTTAWISSEKRIVSFSPQADFRKLSFPTHQEMFNHVVKLGLHGYGIL